MGFHEGRQYRDNRSSAININSFSSTKPGHIYKRRKGLQRISLVAVSFIMILFGSGLVYYYSVLSSIIYKPKPTQNTDTSDNINEGAFDETRSSLLRSSKVLNIMLFGEDDRQDSQFGRSDTMILLSVDTKNKKLKFTSFMRDTYLEIPGYYYSKLTGAYAIGGAELSIKTIEANFGIQIDRYAVVDFKSFREIIDVLGGIELDLAEDDIEYINEQSYHNNQADNPEEIPVVPGKTRLNGRQALWYARNRGLDYREGFGISVAGDDFTRTSKQRKLLNTLVKDMRSASLQQILDIVGKVGPLIETNLNMDEITLLLSKSMKYLKFSTAEYRIPQDELWEDYWPNPDEQALRIFDMDESRYQLARFIYYEDLAASRGTEPDVSDDEDTGDYGDADGY